jgi:hypothetical protein
MWRPVLAVLFVIVGVFLAAFFAMYGWKDWVQLKQAWGVFAAIPADGNMTAVLRAYAVQDAHRLNVFAELVAALLGLNLAALGCVLGFAGTSRPAEPAP